MGSFHTRRGGAGVAGWGSRQVWRASVRMKSHRGRVWILSSATPCLRSVAPSLRRGAKQHRDCYQPWCGLHQPSLLFNDGGLSFLAEYSIHSRLCKSKYGCGRTGRCCTLAAAVCCLHETIATFAICTKLLRQPTGRVQHSPLLRSDTDANVPVL